MRDSCYNKAISKLNDCLREAKNFGEVDPNCCFMATAGTDGQPSVRIITIYDINENGLLFIAKKTSGKIIQLLQNPKTGICFYWPLIKLQVTVEGIVEVLDQQESENLWLRRDHNANIAAWAANMAENNSEGNESSENYKQAVIEKFQGTRPPIPPSWSGFALKPTRIEFWQTEWKKNKKHECYTKKGGFWHESHFH